MSEDLIAILITIAIIAVFFAWMPFLNFVCPPCGRFLERRRLQKDAPREAAVPLTTVRRKAS